MADVVDIPEFRAFYYTDDTPRQFYTLRRYEDESGSGKMHCYNIAPGIQLSFNDLNLSSCYQPLNVQKDFLEINYCLEGGHEVEMVGGGITFLGEKDLSISGLYHDKRVIVNSRTFFPKTLPYCDVEQTVYSYDIDRANQLLDEAGYIDTDGDGIREKDGEKLSSPFQYQAGSASDDNLVVYICDQLGKIGIELTPQSAQMMDWYAMITTGEYGLTLFKTQGGFYDPGNTIGNIDPSMAMDPIISQVAAYLPGGADLITELESTTDEERIQEIYGIILTTMADQCLTTPLVYPHQLAVYSDKIANYDFPPDANFTAVQNITLK